MSLVDWKTTSAQTRLKQYELIAKADLIILKRNSSNFTAWLEAQAIHCTEMDLNSILLIGPGTGIEDTHPVHNKFSSRKTLFDIYGQVTLEEITLLSNEIVAKTDAPGLIEIQKNRCLYKRLFNSSDMELQNHLSVNTSTTLRSGLITLKVLIDYVTKADRESVRNAEKELHDLRLKDYNFDVSKVVTKIRTIIKTLKNNGIL